MMAKQTTVVVTGSLRINSHNYLISFKQERHSIDMLFLFTETSPLRQAFLQLCNTTADKIAYSDKTKEVNSNLWQAVLLFIL